MTMPHVSEAIHVTLVAGREAHENGVTEREKQKAGVKRVTVSRREERDPADDVPLAPRQVPDRPKATGTVKADHTPAKADGAARVYPGVVVPAAPPLTGKVVEVPFGSSEGPQFLHQETPIYPFFARRMGKEGHVVLRLHIDRRGLLRQVEVVRPGDFGFTEAAVEALKKSTFRPALRDGEGVDSRALLTVWFKLSRD